MNNSFSPGSIGQVIRDALTTYLSDALQEFGQELQDDAQGAAPSLTGDLEESIRWTQLGQLGGELSMLGYGEPVMVGHIVSRWGTTRYPLRRLKYKTGGYVKSNPFLYRALQAPVSDPTQRALRSYVYDHLADLGLAPRDVLV